MINRLDDDQTRLPALEQLVGFIRTRPFSPQFGGFASTGDPKLDALHDRAVETVMKLEDFETIEQSLRSPSPTLQVWAMWHWSGDDGEFSVEKWKRLIPRLRELAEKGDSEARGEAQNKLGGLRDPVEDRFLDGLIQIETDPYNLKNLIGTGYGTRNKSECTALFNQQMLRLLGSKDRFVRQDALVFIGSMSGRAENYQVTLSDAVFQMVMELSHSPISRERSHAAYALIDIRKMHPEQHSGAIRARMIEMASDPSEDVRSGIPFAFDDELDKEDARVILDWLLHDESPSVRLSAILILGAEKHVKELREIAAESNGGLASWADPARRAEYMLERMNDAP